jgi:thiol-disulfide isomerase/thioredoxin
MVRDGFSWSGNERNCAFLNCGSQDDTNRFANISAVSGLNFPDDARSIAVVDWDHDGDLDLWIRNRTAPRLRLMINRTGVGTRTNRFAAFKLIGIHCNRDAIGARVELKVSRDKSAGGNRQPVTRTLPLIQTLHAGNGYLAQSSKWLHFGLGNTDHVDEVIVNWPGGERESFGSVQAGERYVLREGSGRATAWKAKSRQLQLEHSVPSLPPLQAAAWIRLPRRIYMPELIYRRFDAAETYQLEPGSKPLLVTLWASWCESCLRELGSFGEAQQQLRDAGLDILALSVDELSGSDDPRASATAEPLPDAIGFPFPTGIVQRASLEKLLHLQRVLLSYHVDFAVPFSYLLDEQRRLVAIYRGPVSIDVLLDDIAGMKLSVSEMRDRAMPYAGHWYTLTGSEDRLAEYLAKEFLGDYPAEAARYFQMASDLATSEERRHHLAENAISILNQLQHQPPPAAN